MHDGEDGKPTFRLPSDSHLRSHLEKVDRGTRRRGSVVGTTATVADAVTLLREGSGGTDPDDLVRQNELMARAAQGRHCERIDFSTGGLDCEYTLERENFLLMDGSRRMVAEPCEASARVAFQPSTPRVLHHVSAGVYARYGLWWTVFQQAPTQCGTFGALSVSACS